MRRLAAQQAGLKVLFRKERSKEPLVLFYPL